MSAAVRWVMVVSLVLGAGIGRVAAEEQAPAVMDSAMKTMLANMEQYGTPGEDHQKLESFIGNWNYTMQSWQSPESPGMTMTGTSKHSFIFGGRFLLDEFVRESEGYPPFEGMGLIGYDTIRGEYQTVWLDNKGTDMHFSTGQFDVASSTLLESGHYSSPMTGEAQKAFRGSWIIVDADHLTYERYLRTAAGEEFKSVELQYSRIQ